MVDHTLPITDSPSSKTFPTLSVAEINVFGTIAPLPSTGVPYVAFPISYHCDIHFLGSEIWDAFLASEYNMPKNWRRSSRIDFRCPVLDTMVLYHLRVIVATLEIADLSGITMDRNRARLFVRYDIVYLRMFCRGRSNTTA